MDYKKMYKLLKKAELYEKQGLRNKELEIYEEIHSDFKPNTSKAFLRPIILYEKKGDLEKAYNLCVEAISLIQENKISGTAKSFIKKQKIIERKMNQSPRKESSNHPILKSLLILLILMGTLVLFILNVEIENPTYENLEVDLSELKEQHLAGGEEIFDTQEPPEYVITESMIENARTFINKNSSVVDSVIIVDGADLGFGLLVTDETFFKEGKELSKDYVKKLGKLAAQKYKLSPNVGGGFSEIYNHYNIYISVGSSNKPEDLMVTGYKLKTQDKIIFKEPRK